MIDKHSELASPRDPASRLELMNAIKNQCEANVLITGVLLTLASGNSIKAEDMEGLVAHNAISLRYLQSLLDGIAL